MSIDRMTRVVAALTLAPLFAGAVMLLGLELLLRRRAAGRGSTSDPAEDAVIRAYRQRFQRTT